VTSVPEANIDELATAVRDGAQVIDVRETYEYVAGHVPGAALIPMAELPSRADELDRTRPVYVICASGNRSSAMAAFLRQTGVDARNVTGGTGAWAAAGRALEAGPAARS
jgi:rhodanese-related sulfurtransferase